MLQLVFPNDLDQSLAMGRAADATFFAFSGGNEPGYICYVIGAHGLQDFNGGSKSMSAGMACENMSLCIMTNSMLGTMTMQKLLWAVFAMETMPLFDTLPSHHGSVRDLVPFPSEWGSPGKEQKAWKAFVGGWQPQEQHGIVGWQGSENRFIVSEEGRRPFLQLKDIGKAMQSLPGLIPWKAAGAGDLQPCRVVDGLAMALRLIKRGEDECFIEMMQQKVTTLKRCL